MSNNKWMDDPVLNGISNEKLEMLTKIIEGAKGMEPKQMLTYFMQRVSGIFHLLPAQSNNVNLYFLF